MGHHTKWNYLKKRGRSTAMESCLRFIVKLKNDPAMWVFFIKNIYMFTDLCVYMKVLEGYIKKCS